MLSPLRCRVATATALLLPLLGGDFLASAPARAQSTSPVRVPLQWASDPDNTSIRKLGLLAALNGGQPQLFEFDTGGTGFFATYGNGSTWWGSAPACSTSPCTPFTTTYDSGLTYSGNLVSGSVTLFGGTAAHPLLSATGLSLGQTTSITCNPAADCASKIGKTSESGWDSATGQRQPPVQGNFYGDFGLSLRNGGSAGPNSLITQDAFWAAFDPAIRRGYRVHAASSNPWVQFGLSAADLAPQPRRFALNSTGGTSVGSLQVSDGSTVFAAPDLTTLLFDTGATTTIHTGHITINNVSFPPGNVPCSLTSLGCPFPTNQPNSTTVLNGAQVQMSGLSLSTGLPIPILDFVAGSTKTTSPAFNEVAVQGYSTASSNLAPACAALPSPQPCFYVNTGILPFLSNDVIVDLASWSIANPQGDLTLIPQVPAPPALAAPFFALAAARRLRRRLLPQRKA